MIKFAIPAAALICFSAVSSLAAPASKSGRSKNRASSEASSKKKSSSSSKKSAKSRKSTKASKSKSSARSKSSGKRDRTPEASAPSWIDELPEVELPEESGPAEDELLEPVTPAAPLP